MLVNSDSILYHSTELYIKFFNDLCYVQSNKTHCFQESQIARLGKAKNKAIDNSDVVLYWLHVTFQKSRFSSVMSRVQKI